MELINPLIQTYADNLLNNDDHLLEQIAIQTEKHPHAHMMSSRLQGKFLQLISSIIKPKKILEIGTFTGYSALCLAKGLQQNGTLHTIELRETDAETAQSNFNHSIYHNQIILHKGNALTIVPQLNEVWDMVFIDADKTGYFQYYNLVLPLIKPGGVILADNVLFHGQVVEQPLAGKNAKAISEFNEYVKNDNRVDQVLLTIRDGLMLIVKK